MNTLTLARNHAQVKLHLLNVWSEVAAGARAEASAAEATTAKVEEVLAAYAGHCNPANAALLLLSGQCFFYREKILVPSFREYYLRWVAQITKGADAIH